ncbi:PepSY domain-containing protein [Sedimentitalea nanhaiensis]|uniref:Peptidase propeptide and YPEB domain-containing protein n=1 Tax=Sedimentitalea nanhaiensis TaxID=999627 RepID=A0A1I7E712_9RHOB|nr:PepSY domain-containing protein [Sedimentitalea nanhaiensis]SFU19685.1 Peptidase propeptide and YPEB domain-containing protein [Sedimentitalea nanhaiensis]
MKQTFALIMSLIVAAPAIADEDRPSDEIVARIEAKLAEMKCQMDPDDIEIEEDGYDLDDVICEGGDQFDILLDTHLNEVSRRAE